MQARARTRSGQALHYALQSATIIVSIYDGQKTLHSRPQRFITSQYERIFGARGRGAHIS